MAVTQESHANSKKTVEEPVHCGRGDPSTRPKGIMKDDCGVVKSHKQQGKRIRQNSDRLSDIDDIEVAGYLHSKEGMHLKRILWEAMNERYIKAKKQKKAAEKKKGVSVKKACKTTEKVEPERRSSRINYESLRSLNVNLKSCESGEITGPDSRGCGSQSSPNGKSRHSLHGSNNSWYEEEDELHEYDNETFGNIEDDTHCEYNNEDYYYDDFDS